MKIVFCHTDFNHNPGEFCPRLRLDQHFISFFRTDFLYEGKNGELLFGHSGEVLIIPRGEVVYHGPTPQMKEGFRNDWMYVEGEDFGELVRALGLPVSVPFQCAGSTDLTHCIHKIKAEQADAAEGTSELCELYLKEALFKLRRAYQRDQGDGRDEKIKSLRSKFIDAPHEDWSLETMAKLCGYSPSHFSALYHEAYGVSPMADLIGIRIENAKTMLAYSNQPIAEIGAYVGFSSIYYFSKCFKKNVGCSPSRYRKQFTK